MKKRILAIALALMMVFSMISAISFNVSAASSHSVTVATNAYYTIKNLGSGKLLNVYGSRNANNTNVTVYRLDETSGQSWEFIKNGSSHVIVPQCSPSRALNVYGSYSKENSNVCIWNQTFSSTQSWIIEYNANLSGYIIRSANNINYVLTATGSANGSNVCLKKYTGSRYQIWDCSAFRATVNRPDKGSNSIEMKNFLQVDSLWSSRMYKTGRIKDTGCGILSIVNAVYNLNGNYMDPIMVADWAHSNGLYNRYGSEGCYADVFRRVADNFGVSYGFQCTYSGNGNSYDTRLKNHIINGGTAIVHVPGHFMTIVDYDQNTGKYLVFDSAPGSGTNYNSIKRKNLTSPNGDWKTPAQLSSGNLKIDRYYLFAVR